ncbi:MAG: VWA domain-containing protein [Acidobacteria bacterium]|nr:VWA domain-containing protein [Acidobacteriota bacterium]
MAGTLVKILISITLVLITSALAITGSSQSALTTKELTQVFQIDLPSADAAILMDASLSMRNHHYDVVRQTVIDFVSTLTGNETLHIRVFGDVASIPLEGTADKIAGNVAAHLPTEPMFQHTDLGTAILKGLEFFERDGAGELQALFLFTDGMHQPPASSLFTRDFTSDQNWHALRRRAQALCQRRKVFVYGFGLGSQTDVSLLLKIFPPANVEVVVGEAAQVADVLRAIRESLRLAQLRHAVEQDLSSGGVEVRFAQSGLSRGARSIENQVTIQNRYRYLPVVLESIKLQYSAEASREIECDVENLPRNLTLVPAQMWRGKLRARLLSVPSNLRLGRIERIYSAGVQVMPAARFEHAAEIAMLDAGNAIPLCNSPPLGIELRASYGVPYYLIIFFSIAGLGFVLIIRRKRKLSERVRTSVEQRHAERKRLAGMLKLWHSGKAEPDEEGVDLSAYKTLKLDLVINANGMLEVASPDSQARNVVAYLSGHLFGASPVKAETGRVEYRLETARGHRLAYESTGGLRETARLILCDRDLIEIDGTWRLRYANHRLRTRVEVESAC